MRNRIPRAKWCVGVSLHPDPPPRRPLFGLARLAVRAQRLADDGDRLVGSEMLDVHSKGLDQIVELGRFARTVDEDGQAERAVDDEGSVARVENGTPLAVLQGACLPLI